MQSLSNTGISFAAELNGRHVSVRRTDALPDEPYKIILSHSLTIFLTREQAVQIATDLTALITVDSRDLVEDAS